jgi:hypothetical protein
LISPEINVTREKIYNVLPQFDATDKRKKTPDRYGATKAAGTDFADIILSTLNALGAIGAIVTSPLPEKLKIRKSLANIFPTFKY